nr:hypothetical protein CFP56_18257 [Quercus suber]
MHKKVFANLEPEVKVPANQDQNHVVEPQTTLEEAEELLRRLTEEVRKNQLANYMSNGEEFKDADADSNNFEDLFGNFRGAQQAPIHVPRQGPVLVYPPPRLSCQKGSLNLENLLAG